ncbi:MAG TPA: ABC transporter ATP-binding protein, partial [Trueperaceae bacterium]
EVGAGELVVVLGPSGSGKTTLLNIVGGIDAATSGSVLVDGEDIGGYDQRRLTEYRRRVVGFVFQFFNLVPSLTALENVALIAGLTGSEERAEAAGERAEAAEQRAGTRVGAAADRAGHRAGGAGERVATATDEARDALAAVGLAGRLDHFPAALSGGEQQRVAIARALAKRPSLLLCDEPTGALDLDTGRSVLSLLRRVNRERSLTTVLVTHNSAIAKMADRVVRMRDGRVEEDRVVTDPLPAEEVTW